MPFQLLNRYRYHGTTTYFALWPYVQVRIKRNNMMVKRGDGAVCVAWLWWSVRYTWRIN